MSNNNQSQRVISYLRVSTNQQEKSGLGLEAQKEIVGKYAENFGAEILQEFVEVESGGKNDRPVLAEALRMARLKNAVLVIAKLDRLSRNLAFMACLMDSGVRFVCCDNPNANDMTIHILAAVAQQERKLISERTKAALARKKAQGFKLGNPNLHLVRNTDTRRATAASKAATQSWLSDIKDAVSQFDHMTLAAAADALNDLGFTTRRGKQWSAMQVSRVRMSY
ncbi:recombinase family protein [Motiliproteus sediminis]|uniref:recombinase family protein n=1 Tax=Motiliproteus sediminis TaxID=1468178 RepID=UPI001AEFE5E1|nr:recombinase family protein [Motiliproteus sediminis]